LNLIYLYLDEILNKEKIANEPYGCIVLTTDEWFKRCLEKKCSIFQFPPGHNPRGLNRLSYGSICLILTKPGLSVSRSEWAFVGEFIVKNIEKIEGTRSHLYASKAIVTPEAPLPKKDQNSWIIEFENLTEYERHVKLAECIDIIINKKPLSEWRISGFSLIRPENFHRIISSIRNKARSYERPDHKKLVEELMQLGEILGFTVNKEEYTPDNLFRLDVTWRDDPGHAPLKAFEVELSGQVDKALARLSHAYDHWHCEQLWLVVSDEESSEKARKLVEPMLKGSFSKIRKKTHIISWKDLHEMYTAIVLHKEHLKELSKR
jgi:hypothetical protein